MRPEVPCGILAGTQRREWVGAAAETPLSIGLPRRESPIHIAGYVLGEIGKPVDSRCRVKPTDRHNLDAALGGCHKTPIGLERPS